MWPWGRDRRERGSVVDGDRWALLVGVGDAPGAGHLLSSLRDPVDADLRALDDALRGSGYTVEVLRDPTRNEITERITDLARDVPPGATLLLYFTGHGIRVGGTDYLVPADARAPSPGPEGPGGTPSGGAPGGAPGGGWERPHVRESLLDADVSRYLDDCAAGTVLWLVDACRDAPGEQDATGDGNGGGRDGGKDGTTDDAPFGSHVTQGPPRAGFAMMTGCGPGRRSGFTPTGSFFSLALAHAFDPLTEAATVEEVFRAARQETRGRALRAGVEQDVRVRYGAEREAETRALPVAEGRRLLETWQETVRAPRLWDHVPDAEAAAIGHFQECLSALAADVARQVDHAQRRLPDPWADDEYPIRLLRDRLPLLLPKGEALSALEVTALIAGVLLYEAAWADRLSQAAEFHPFRTSRLPDADDRRRYYEQITEHHPQITEKLTGWWRAAKSGPLEARTAPGEDHRAVVLWLVHRWIGERFATDEEAVPAALAAAFVARLLAVPPPDDGVLTGRAAQTSAALRAVAGGLVLGVPPETQDQNAGHGPALPARHVVPSGPAAKTAYQLRVRPLSALLRLAGLTALDTRRLPEVVAEHLAISDPVRIRDVLTAVRDAHWDLEHGADSPGYLHLDAVCPHPALHAALASVVEDADGLGYELREAAARLPVEESALLRGLPARLTDRGLRPDVERGIEAYDVPLARFSLAQTEIRRLLMGERLYEGKPALAVRELYQNAMDACRYREMRTRYLRGCGREPAAWEGRIDVRAGEDARGRYVECVDNGVGMTVDQLKGTFTRAGRRFDQSHAFRREQATWLRHDRALRLYPNSRFGIGVFSYFMLADEMVITTRAVGTDGRPAARALRVEIPVSGSLFRVREADERDGALLPEGGTCVRLYLRAGRHLGGRSLAETLRSLVLVAEFALDVVGDDGTRAHWPAGELQPGAGNCTIEAEDAVEAVPGTLWWVEGTGAVLCDGIVADERPFGYVLNLTGAHAGDLNVSRTKLESYDRAWELEQVRRGERALAGWNGLTLDWLRTLEKRHRRLARVLWKEWRGRGVRAANGHGATADLDVVGWFRLDSAVEERNTEAAPHWLRNAVRPWRLEVLGLRHPGRSVAVPESLAGHPVPVPGWSAIADGGVRDWRRAVMTAYEQGITVAEVLVAARGLRIVHPRLAPPAVRGSGLDWRPRHHDRRILTGLLGKERNRYASDASKTIRSPLESVYRHPTRDLSGIVRASAEFRLPLGKLVEACGRYAPLVPGLRLDVPDHHRDHVCGEADLHSLYRRGAPDWVPVTTPWDVRLMAEQRGIGLPEAYRALSAFGWLRPVPDEAAVERWAEVPADLFPALAGSVVADDAGRLVLPLAATLSLAADWGEPVRDVERALAREAKVLGLDHRRHYTRRTAEGETYLSEETGLLVDSLHEKGIRLEDGVTLRDLSFANPMSPADLAECVEELRGAGVRLPDAARLLEAWEELPTRSRYAFSGTDPNWDESNYPVAATAAVLFSAGEQLRENLGFLWDTATNEARRLELAAELVAPAPPAELRAFTPTKDDAAALVGWGLDDEDDDYDEDDYDWAGTPVWTRLTPHRLATYAHETHKSPRAAYAHLAPLRAVGALVPELPADVLAALPDEEPGAHDVCALDPDLRVSKAGTPLVPLDLVSLAARLGEPVSRTWRRISPYLGLEPAPPEVGELPDVMPVWQDLALLTEGLDGRLPAVAGTVGAEHVARAAEAVRETPGWVRARLELYAAAFEYALEPERQHVDGDGDEEART